MHSQSCHRKILLVTVFCLGSCRPVTGDPWACMVAGCQISS
uniref:Uncharacterized protein n=1 Tax=Anguilla anguilla TaxID=7936 RepID=A0A0E9VDK7_ANGAN